MAQSMGDLRSFTAKKNKVSAAEARRQVVEGNYLLHNSAALLSETSIVSKAPPNHQTLSLIDVASPIDLEEALSSRTIARTEIRQTNSSPQRLRDFMEKDVSITTLPRDRPFLPDVITALGRDDVEPHVKDLIINYERDFTVIERPFGKFSSAETYARLSSERSLLADAVPRHTFETDIDNEPQSKASRRTTSPDFKRQSTVSSESASSSGSKDEARMQTLQSSTTDPVISTLITREMSTDFDEKPCRKSLGGVPYLVNLLPLQKETDIVERRMVPPVPGVQTGKSLLVAIQQFQLDPVAEPIFGSLTLYDVHERRRISETFYFELNTPNTLRMIQAHITPSDEAAQSRQALFDVANLSSSVFLVFKVEKVLQGAEVADAMELYTREDKNREKLIQGAKENCERLGAHRMLVGWTGVELNAVINNAHAMRASTASESAFQSNEEIAAGVAHHDRPSADTESVISADRLSCMTSETLQQQAHSDDAPSVDAVPRRRQLLPSSPASQTDTWSNLRSVQPLSININSFYKQVR
ncbi:dedicator of cytokinesis protein 6-like isoform X1 [Aphelenchoides avenae]|nr:dedicator of cytokinesis protein 6-like isoform X1 [Aphelenchus avenae]